MRRSSIGILSLDAGSFTEGHAWFFLQDPENYYDHHPGAPEHRTPGRFRAVKKVLNVYQIAHPTINCVAINAEFQKFAF
jgi:hypothetical protein